MERRLDPRLRRAGLDWIAPVLIVVVGVVNVTAQPHSTAYPGSPWRHVVFVVAAATALGLRRRAPWAAPVAAILVVTWWTATWPTGTQGPFEGFLVLVGAAYSLATIRDRRRLLAGGGALLAWFAVGMFTDLVGGRAGDVAPLMVWITIGFAVGLVLSRRTDEAQEARTTAQVLAAEQERRTERAIEEERARIARELHDVVAHGLSVIVVQAGAERRALSSGAAPADLASVTAALGAIEHAGREAMVDLRRLLGLLRRTDDPVSLAPQPGLAQLADLVGAARETGLQVALEIADAPSPLPPGLDLTAYRIVQEAVTNVLKHANARSVVVSVAVHHGQLDVRVSDDGSRLPGLRATGDGSGHGLVGMRERAKIFGGTVRAGVQPGGGWQVHARLPITAGGT